MGFYIGAELQILHSRSATEQIENSHAYRYAVGHLAENDGSIAVGYAALHLHPAVHGTGMHNGKIRIFFQMLHSDAKHPMIFTDTGKKAGALILTLQLYAQRHRYITPAEYLINI